jgi:hypothetical protein
MTKTGLRGQGKNTIPISMAISISIKRKAGKTIRVHGKIAA